MTPDTRTNLPLSKVLVIIPTYNEKENITRLLHDVSARLAGEGHILVVDDNSPDGTAEAVKQLTSRLKNLHLMRRPGKKGLGSAYLEAFRWAQPLDPEMYIHMDADFSHPPELLDSMIYAITEGFDVAVASRYVPGGGTIGWPISRRILSRSGNLAARIILGTGLKDSTSGFRALSRRAVHALLSSTIKELGFGYLVESLFRLRRLGFKASEVPFVYRNRVSGATKLSMRETSRYGSIFVRLAILRLLNK